MPQLSLQTERANTANSGAPNSAALIALIKRAKKGDRASLYDLCAESMTMVYFIALRLVGNRSDAEDVMQESLLRLCQKIGELRDPEAFAGWLSRITTNEARAFYKKNAKHGVILDIDDYLESLSESSRQLLPEEYAESEESREAIVDIIDTLPVRQREAVVLCYYGGLSVTEAAAEMGVDKANVSQYLKLARQKLRAEMEAKSLAPEGGPVKLRSAGLSSGLLLLKLLGREAGFVSVDADAAARALAKCGTTIQTAAAPAAAAAAVGVKALIAPVAVAAGMASVAAAALVTGSAPGGPPPESAAVSAAAAWQAGESVIEFSGGEARGGGYAHLNPASAHIGIPDGDGNAITVTEWWITPQDGGGALYGGAAEDIAGMEAAFSALREESGVYVVWFRMEDTEGFVYRKHRNFRVDGG